MRIRGKVLIAGCIVAVLAFVVVPSSFAQEYAELITEEYLRTQFVFADGEQLKYSRCKKKTYPTCTYIWGVESKRDATRIKHGLAPDGNKLQIIYAQAKSRKDFKRVLASYTDAGKVDGIGVEAVWSERRKQLSFITDKNLIVHINSKVDGSSDCEAKAISIARYLLDKL